MSRRLSCIAGGLREVHAIDKKSILEFFVTVLPRDVNIYSSCFWT